MPRLAAYCAAKAGVDGFVRALGRRAARHRRDRQRRRPGSTGTPILDESARLYELESAEEFPASSRSSGLIEPEEVAAMIGWLPGPASAR